MQNIAHVSIDLETLSTSPAATILSIGIVAVCQATGQERKFYRVTNVASQPDRQIDQSTLAWWSGQSAEARKTFDQATNNTDAAVDLADALSNLTDWIGELGQTHTLYVWGNGANFDVAILEHAYKSISPFVPWNFRNVRDMRTLYQITSLFGLDIRANVKRAGTHHNALDDAQFQANIIVESLKQLTQVASGHRGVNIL